MSLALRGLLRRLSVGLLGVLVCATAAVCLSVPAAAAGSRRPCPNGPVALTFDDGPSPTQTPRLIRILTDLRVPATFFLVGQRVRSAPGVARQLQRSGFVIANHTWSHTLLTTISDRAVRAHLIATGRELRRHDVVPGRLMRPPYGGMDRRVRAAILRTGLLPVLWSVDSRDWAGGNARQIADRILSGLRPHGENIVLQHDAVDNSPASIAAVPLVVTEARRRGYCFTDLDDRGRKRMPVRRLGARPVAGAAASVLPVRTLAPSASRAQDVPATGRGQVLLTLVPSTNGDVGFRFRTVAVATSPRANAGLAPVTTAGVGGPGAVALFDLWLPGH